MLVAGVVGPAKVASFSDGVLVLEYSADYGGLCERGRKILDDINSAFTGLAGMAITCRLQPVEGSDSQQPARRAFGGLSTAETAEIAKDPAVSILIDSFKGTLLDARRDIGPGMPPVDPEVSADDDE